MRPVLVGQAPSRRYGGRPFEGCSGDRLAAYMGLEGREGLLERVEAVNVLERFPGPDGAKGDRFPRGRARRRARHLLPSLRGRTVLLAGKRVAEAFGVNAEYLTWHEHPEGFRVVVIPHPSGVNRWWNEPENRRRFRQFATAVLGGT